MGRSPLAPVLVVCAALVALPGGVVRADDVLVLRSGGEVRGRVAEETAGRVRLEIDGGSVWFDRDAITEIRLDSGSGRRDARPAEETRALREEHALLYANGKRTGTRTFRVLRRPEGLEFSEHVVFLDAEGRPSLELRTLERCDLAYAPVYFQVQEQAAGERHRLVRGTVSGATLTITDTRDGDEQAREAALRPGGQFPFAAREMFLSGAARGRLESPVFDTRDHRWRDVVYSEEPSKVVRRSDPDASPADVRVRVVVRRRGDLTEREWVAADLHAEMVELNGAALRALRTSQAVVAAVVAGETERVTGPDSAARTRYADGVYGFAIEKPDPSWVFEEPAVRGAGALLSVRNAPLGASVDVLRDEAPPPDLTLERAADSFKRLLRAHAPDLRVLDEGFRDVDGRRVYWLEARATRKGEITRTLGRLHLRDGRAYRLLGACVESAAKACRGDIEKILDSFRFVRGD